MNDKGTAPAIFLLKKISCVSFQIHVTGFIRAEIDIHIYLSIHFKSAGLGRWLSREHLLSCRTSQVQSLAPQVKDSMVASVEKRPFLT